MVNHYTVTYNITRQLYFNKIIKFKKALKHAVAKTLINNSSYNSHYL